MKPLERTEVLYAVLSTLEKEARGMKGIAGKVKDKERYRYIMGMSHGITRAANLLRTNLLQKEGDFFI